MARRSPKPFSEHNTFSELIGLRFLTREGGSSVCALDVADQLLNPNGVVHGGVIYSLADTGMGGALHSLMEDGVRCATIEIKIVYLKPVTEGTLTCATKVIQKGRRIAVLESEVENEARLVAKAMGTFSILDVPPAEHRNHARAISARRVAKKSKKK